MQFSNKWNAQRGAKRAGLDPASLEFVEVGGRWTWREPEDVIAQAVSLIGDPITMMTALVARYEGATVTEIAEATGLSKEQAHAKITSQLKKRLGLKIASDTKDKARGGRIYRAIGEVRRSELPFFTAGAAHEAHA